MLPNNVTDYAYNANNYLVIFNQQNAAHHDWSSLTVIMHEVGHSLDLDGYRDRPLSASDKWRAALDQDSMVPDAYAGTDVREDVAQNTVIATYDLVVPGGLGNVKGVDWHGIQHQYELIKREQADANTSNLLVPGGQCVTRLPNSPAVQISGKKRTRRAPRGVNLLKGKPNTDLVEGLKVLVPSRNFSTEYFCHRPEGA